MQVPVEETGILVEVKAGFSFAFMGLRRAEFIVKPRERPSAGPTNGGERV
jgi:hypothetical protein